MKNKGFTLIEIMVVIGIIVILSTIIFPSFGSGTKNLALQRAIHTLSQNLKWAQKMSLGTEKIAGTIPYAYGIYINTNEPDHYIIFADCIPLGNTNSNYIYDPNSSNCNGNSELIEDIQLEKEVKIKETKIKIGSNILTTTETNILFLFPYPRVGVVGEGGSIFGNEAWITLTLKDDLTKTKKIYINRVGLIKIED